VVLAAGVVAELKLGEGRQVEAGAVIAAVKPAVIEKESPQ
jgi:biotin carboxyl carrier protein